MVYVLYNIFMCMEYAVNIPVTVETSPCFAAGGRTVCTKISSINMTAAVREQAPRQQNGLTYSCPASI